MKFVSTFGIAYALAISTVCAKVFEQPQALPAEPLTPVPVPESSFALIVGGALWLLLLRKRA